MRKPAASSDQTGTGLETSLRRARIVGVALILLTAMLSMGYVDLAWHRFYNGEVDEAVATGQTVAALIYPTQIAVMNAQPSDRRAAQYQEAQQALTRLVSANPSITYAYVAVRREDGTPVLLVDSIGDGTAETASQKLHFSKDAAMIREAFSQNRTVLSGDLSREIDSQIGTLTPIRDDSTGTTVAVLGLDYPSVDWYASIYSRLLPVAIASLFVLFLSIALFRNKIQHLTLSDLSRRLSADETLFHSVFDQAPIGISIGTDDMATYDSPGLQYSVNRKFEQIMGRNRDELKLIHWRDITHPDDLAEDLSQLDRFKKGEIPGYAMEKRFLRPDGSSIWTHMIIGTLTGTAQEDAMHLCILEDISERKQIEEALRESERSKEVLLSHLPGMAYRCRYDHSWTMEFVSEGCEALTGFQPESLMFNRDISYNELIVPEYRELLWNEWERILPQRTHFRYEYEITTRQKERKWVLEMGQFVFDRKGEVSALEGIVVDITAQKMREAQVDYLSEHDFLTGLFNRGHFDREKGRLAQADNLPLSVVICDINGVRMINDGFGLAEGDRLIADVAHLLRLCAGESDVLCRTGGDEFTLLLPHTDEEDAGAFMRRIESVVGQANRKEHQRPYEISLSVGCSTMSRMDQRIDQVFAEAEEFLNHRKLLNQKSSHNSILSSIMAALYARSHETEEHGKRLTRLTRMIGIELGLDQNTLDDLVLLSMLHDIGKVGIDDRILNKPDKLDPDEWEQMKLHSVIGYRITRSTPEFEHIADYILYHHEQWDGNGYPEHLRQDEIPLTSRILTVADAYDAMTEDRVYRRAMPEEEALLEIERCSGTQFDPKIAQVFVRQMRKEDAENA